MAGFLTEDEHNAARENMLLGQLIPNRLHNAGMLKAMGKVARELFLPDRLKSRAYADESIYLNPHTIMFSPRILASLMLLANLRRSDFVLDVKSATGYSAAVMANMTQAVVALESDSGMCETAQQILIDSEIDNVAVLNRNPDLGFPSQAPFDVIFIEGIVSQIPETLLDQMAENGRLVCVVAKNADTTGKATKVVKNNGSLSYTTEFEVDLSGFVRFPFYKNFVFETVS